MKRPICSVIWFRMSSVKRLRKIDGPMTRTSFRLYYFGLRLAA